MIKHLLFFLCAAFPAMAQQTQRLELNAENGSSASFTSVFSLVPPGGFAPVRISITNNGTVAIPLSLTTSSRTDGGAQCSTESSFQVSGAAESTTTSDILIPLSIDLSPKVTYGNGELTIKAGSNSLSFNATSINEGFPFVAFSAMLCPRGADHLNRERDTRMTSTPASSYGGSSHSSGYGSQFACTFEPSMLPADWRGLSGLDGLSLLKSEWEALAPGPRNAVTLWLRAGGLLTIYFVGTEPVPGELGIAVDPGLENGGGDAKEDAKTERRAPVGKGLTAGVGLVRFAQWTGRELPATEEMNYTSASLNPWEPRLPRSLQLHSLSDADNPRLLALGQKDFNAWQVGLLLLVFGVVVGPINLFWFAGPGRRHRLFFTTPLISLIASLLLLAVVFFQDGLGGTGTRAAAIHLDSARNSFHTYQEQYARTGVLLGSGFDLAPDTLVRAAPVPEGRWARLTVEDSSGGNYRRRMRDSKDQRYTVAGGKAYAGDYFQSRSEQAQIIESNSATRGGLELKPEGTTPVITSRMETPIDRIYYRSADGNYWRSPGAVATGASVVMEAVDPLSYAAGIKTMTAVLSVKARKHLAMKAEAPGYFHAQVNDAYSLMVPTLDSIKWKENTAYVHGPLR